MHVDHNVGHLAWCALIALALARRDGLADSSAEENLFLIRWLSVAEKQRRFSRELNADIRWLLREGRQKGIHADLPAKLRFLWRTASGKLLEQNDLYRLQNALQSARSAGWIYMVLNHSEWEGRRAVKLSSQVSGIYLLRGGLDEGFSEHGIQTKPLPVRITGNVSQLESILRQSGWFMEPAGREINSYRLIANSRK